MLSPLLFNLFINDLAIYLKSPDLGIKAGDETVCLYADDIVLLAECETDLQLLLNALYNRCGQNDMKVNLAKRNVVHFRQNCVSETDVLLSFGDGLIGVIDRYTYLGVVLSEHLDYNMSPVKRICVFEHSVMTNFNYACPAIQRSQGSGFLV